MDEIEKQRIFDYLDNQETEELVNLWKKHDLNEWREVAFEVMEEIIETRTGLKPDQIQIPVFEPENMIDDINNPVKPQFYKPDSVEKICNWLDVGSKILLVCSIILSITQWDSYNYLVRSWFYLSKIINWEPTEILLTVILILLNIAVSVIIAYLPLRALRYILKMLMQMEFNSRDNH